MTDWLCVHKKSLSIGVTHGHVIFSNTFQLFGLRWWTGRMNGREAPKPVWFKTKTHLLWAWNTHFPQNIPVNFISMVALLCLVNKKVRLKMHFSASQNTRWPANWCWLVNEEASMSPWLFQLRANKPGAARAGRASLVGKTGEGTSNANYNGYPKF